MTGSSKYRFSSMKAGDYQSRGDDSCQDLEGRMSANIARASSVEERAHAWDQIAYALAARAIRAESAAHLYGLIGCGPSGEWS